MAGNTSYEVRVRPERVEAALVLRLTGLLLGAEVERTAVKLADVTGVLPPPRCVVLDLRDVDGLSAAGARMLGEFARRNAKQDIRSAAVLGRGTAAGRLVASTVGPDLLPVHDTVDAVVRGHLPESPKSMEGLDDQLAALTRMLLDASTLEQVLRQVAAATTVLIPHAEVVSVTLRDPAGRFFTPVETDGVATELDRTQYETGTGPCVDVARPDGPGYVVEQDLATTSAWPQFAEAATRNGLGSVLSTTLQPSPEPVALGGALNIYSHRDGITGDDRHRALLLATHASLAIARSQVAELAAIEAAHLRTAVEARDVIGQAKGILMARQGLTADEAFDLLRRTSQDVNVKLADIAAALVGHCGEHGELSRPDSRRG
ncbi:ANTAR domain-containing protein [Amycolatopsis albispora]|uniref:ANTAR domain-containing protein n=1 Tax=Amycolatopsis albispora TaxID=1804986 RepID=UPI001F459EAE|nr:ANTAR domain-containing protein [Amycolatopsis albispora]